MTEPPPSTPEAAERRSRLYGIKLGALVAGHLGRELTAAPQPFPGGAAMIVDGAAWVMVDDDEAGRLLGGALAWALRNEATALHLVASADTGLLARRGARFGFPIDVWFAEERSLLPSPAEPLAPPAEPRPEHLRLTGLIDTAGATPNVEHGVVFGEVRGLEVCRVVDQPTVGHLAEPHLPPPPTAGGVLLEVGVGATDREAFQIVHGDVPTVEALRGVVSAVEQSRSADSPQHPLNRLAAERFLRWQAEQDPAAFGMRSVVPAQPPLPRPNLRDAVPCVAAGVDVGGREVAVVFSTGVDLDLAPYVVDVHAMSDRELVVVAPERDLVPIARELIDLLDFPVRLVGVA